MRTLVLCLAVLAVAGCGGGDPALPPETAEPLARQAGAVAARLAAGDGCAARRHAQALQERTIGAINAGRIPPELQEPLLGRANALVSELALACLPSVRPTTETSVAPPPGGGERGDDGRDDEKGKDKDRGKDKGKGKGKDKDKGRDKDDDDRGRGGDG